MDIHALPCKIISTAIFISGLPDSQIDTNEYVCVSERKTERQNGRGGSLLSIQQSLTILSFSDSDQVWLTETA